MMKTIKSLNLQEDPKPKGAKAHPPPQSARVETKESPNENINVKVSQISLDLSKLNADKALKSKDFQKVRASGVSQALESNYNLSSSDDEEVKR